MDVSANKGGTGDVYVVGVDFGTLSARALVVRVSDGAEAGTAVCEYAHGVIDRELAGRELPPDWALQDPGDYTEALSVVVPAAITDAGIDPGRVIGVATDFTALAPACRCSPTGTPLCQLPELAGRPHAYPKLWKHHAAQPQADRINAAAHERHEKWINRYGGKISAEWQFAKALQVLDEDPEIYARRPLDRGRGLDRLAAVRDRDPQRVHRRVQGHLPGRAVPVAGLPAPRSTRASPAFAADKLAHPISPLGGLAGGRTAAARRADRAARRDRGRRRQRRRPRHRARGGPDGAGQDGGDHGHLDLPHGERHEARRVAGPVRGGGRRHRGRAVGLRGGPERGRRHLRLVHEERGAR